MRGEVAMEAVDFALPEGTKSLNLYKLHPPFRRLIDGHGYPGVLLERVSDEKIQCHICGEWFCHLGNHVVQTHKINAKQYKKKFGLRIKDALASRTFTEKIKKAADSDERRKRMKKMKSLSLQKIKQHKKSWLAAQTGASRNTLAYLNEKGLCPDQVDHRFDVVAALRGKRPSYRDLEQYDLPVLRKIKQRFGTFKKYIEYRGLQPLKSGSSLRISDVDLIAAIRKIYLKKGHVRSRDFPAGGPSCFTIRKRFGNLENALREAGIDSATWAMVG